MWSQVIAVRPLTNFRFTGWVKVDSVYSLEGVGSGAYLTIGREGEWPLNMTSLTGTFDWRKIGFVFTSSAYDYSIIVQARLGIYSGVAKGTVWFDDISVVEM